MIVGLILSAFIARTQTAPLPFVSPVFSDHMVLQRDKPNTLWGWTTPGAPIKVTVFGREARGTADADGKWTVRLNPPPVGGPYEVTIAGPQVVTLHDVLVGDVWICSGQSNMEMGITQVNQAKEEIASATNGQIRLMMVPRLTANDPVKVNPSTWEVCSPDSIVEGGWGGFSAVGYFFGRALNQKLHVPIGLVESSWGGTIAEAWTSRESLSSMHDFDAGLRQVELAKTQTGTPYPQLVAEWFSKNDPGTQESWQSPDYADAAWKTSGDKADFDSIGLSKFDGLVWFRREFELPADANLEGAKIVLGKIDDVDVTWVNGVQVGSTSNWDATRRYDLPSGSLRAGRNVVAVRVMDTAGGGGLYSEPSALFVQLADGTKIPLGGAWKFNVVGDIAHLAPFPQDIANNPNVPTVLYNGMIYPIVPMAIKGAIWYQGESNASRGYQYRRLLPTMISDWRRQFRQGDFPFLIVQLANFMAAPEQPGDDEWAELREAQAMTAQRVRNAGLAVAIDIGDANDIHPKDKQTVGLRLAQAAYKVAYGERIEFSGPTYRSMSRQGDAIRIEFNHTAGGLQALRGKLGGFAIAGADQKWYWADAEIIGNTVLVRSPRVSEPVAVRYAWAANPPVANLYNGAGLPAVPFRTDNWPGLTANRK